MQFNPKFRHVELHSHLDGSLQAETLFKIAKRKGISIKFSNSKDLKDFLIIKEPQDLRFFLKKFDTVIPIIVDDKEAIAEICEDYIKICASAHTCYVEARFSPEMLSGKSCDTDSVLVTVLEVLERSGREHGVKARVILSAIRQLDQLNPNVLELARKYQTHGVVGIDLAGDEKYSLDNEGTTEEIIKLFTEAKKFGIHRTVHAGENGSAAMIDEALEKMHAERIGHGYQALDDEIIYQKLKERNIHLEICPSSSYLTKAVDINLKHPIHRFWDDQINYSISCDDLMITGRNLVEEYDFCRDRFKISNEEIKRCNLNAAKASFLDDDDRESLCDHLMS